ncbi:MULTISPECIES: YhbY family RNA-binding protein [Caproicibacterium]|jgi:RNA-binding protein|uniref:Ribosome assembly RNA-binding protein YhbY n=1 Tax=Caproicibacterium lactatifermentans TaxID=2666138 RepID=A0A859DQJ9_9FIRM|nr:YhbY family RNA-binding protein [Caproicibacterium lactatifermentans]ARP50405.1 RNA-binding protein [Ruminococcaceae bacterium CPB6]QKN23874.1 ribosome assembly RNA-binding protein YhbY [Caproicibacterium lactatifermentans]QKO31056.1 ribosome assembly RNA-binding protein YhbY [Caproicibacterium lactatifermentans]
MLNSKQRAYLRGLANPLETILMVGKGGISSDVEYQADTALEKRELIKGRVLPETCPVSAKEAANILAQAAHAEVVQVIGSRFVLYRRNDKEPKITLPKSRKK